MRRGLVSYLILLVAINLIGLGALFWTGAQNWVYVGGFNIMAAVLIAGSLVQQRIDRGRPRYDEKTFRYHMQSVALWWGIALATGLLIDLLLYLTAEQTIVFLATMLFAGLALAVTPLYLLSEWWAGRRR